MPSTVPWLPSSGAQRALSISDAAGVLGGHVLREHRHPLLDRLAGDRPRHLPAPGRRLGAAAPDPRHQLAPVLGGHHRHPVDAHHLEDQAHDLVEQAVDVGLLRELAGDVEQEVELARLAVLARFAGDLQQRGAARALGELGGDVRADAHRHLAQDGGVERPLAAELLLGRRLVLAHLELHLAEGDPRAGSGEGVGHPRAVEVGAVGRPHVAHPHPRAGELQLGVVAGDRRILDQQVARRHPADGERAAGRDLDPGASGGGDQLQDQEYLAPGTAKSRARNPLRYYNALPLTCNNTTPDCGDPAIARLPDRQRGNISALLPVEPRETSVVPFAGPWEFLVDMWRIRLGVQDAGLSRR